ncbi:beta strand repeat-containing protein [Verrucomicrobiota bacterium sgz303538]
MIESLEPRVAPATLVSPTTLTYTDVDGDLVTVKFTKPLLTQANVNSVFTFSTGTVNGSNSTGQLLQRINLESFGDADGLGISVIAKRGSTGGDGLANVGEIDARVSMGIGLDLGTVVIDGDLGQLRCGDENSSRPGLVSLKADSLGALGTDTQLPASPALILEVAGAVGSIAIKGDCYAAITVLNSSLGQLKIGGSLVGSESGVTAGPVGKIVIGTNVLESFISIESTGSISVGGSIRGSAAQQGYISIEHGAKLIAVAGDVVGSPLVPANGGETGYISAGGRIEKVSIGGSLIANVVAGTLRGGVLRAASFGSIVIGGNIDGGRIQSVGTSVASDGADIGSVTVGGSLIGTELSNSGSIEAGTTDASSTVPEKIGNLGKVVVNGSLLSSSIRDFTAQIVSTGDMGSVKVGGDVICTVADSTSARIVSFSALGKVVVGGSVQGNAFGAGVISAEKDLGSVSIGKNLIGRAGGSGNILAGGSITSVKIGGSIISGVATLSGSIRSGAAIGSVVIKGDLIGNNGTSGLIVAQGRLNPANESAALAIGSITVGGRIEGARIYAGYSADSVAPVNADVQIGKIVCGSWLASNAVAGVTDGGDGFGNAGDTAINSGGVSAVISKIGSVIIKGHARGTVGGTDSFGIVAQEIGTVRISDALVNLIAGKANDTDFSSSRLALGTTGDFHVREVA